MKIAMKEWWGNHKKTVLTAGIIVLVLIIFWCCYYTAYQHIKGENSLVTRLNLLFGSSGDEIVINEEERNENTVIFLIGGMDRFQDLDTIMLAALEKEKKSLRLFSVPKDTLSENGRKNMQISKAYSVGGIEGLKKELKHLTGLPIDRYVLIKHDGFTKLVDHMGGVTITVSEPMDYEDSLQDLSIHLTVGEQTLNGENALDFVRYCGYVDGDLGRIRAQQSFAKAFAKQAISKISTPKEIAKLGAETVVTDMTAGELLWLSGIALQSDAQGDITVEVLPGLTANFLESTYYIVNETAALGLINSKFNPYTEPISELQLSDIGQNLFAGWQWNNGFSAQGYSLELDEEALNDPTRFCEYYYEYASDVLEDSLFADAMDTPDKTKKEYEVPVVAQTPNPLETLTIPKIEVIPQIKDHYIILDPNQNPEDFGIDPEQVEYWTPSPTPEPTPEQPMEPTVTEEPEMETEENEAGSVLDAPVEE